MNTEFPIFDQKVFPGVALLELHNISLDFTINF